MKIIQFTYLILIYLLEGVGFTFNNTWLKKQKQKFNKSCINFYELNLDTPYDDNALALKPIFYSIALSIFIEAIVISAIFNTKAYILIGQMMIAAWFIFVLATNGLITKKMLYSKINVLTKKIEKGVKITFNYILPAALFIYLFIKLILTYPYQPSEEAIQQFMSQESTRIIQLIPWVEVIFLLLGVLLLPFIYILVQFSLGRLIVWLFKKTARFSLKKSKNEPIKIIIHFIGAACIIDLALSFIF